MNMQGEECMPNRYGKYGLTFNNYGNLSKDQIIEKFSIFEDDEPLVFCVQGSIRVFVNYSKKEHTINARNMFPELNAIYAHDKKHKERQIDPEMKRDFNAKNDSDNQSCSSFASTVTRQSYQKGKGKSNENGAASDRGENNIKQKNKDKSNENIAASDRGGNYNTKQKHKDKSNENGTASDRSDNNNKQKHTDGDVEEDLDKMPLLVCPYDVEPCEHLNRSKPIETKVVVLSSLPTWLHPGEVYRLIHESTSLWPLDIHTFLREDGIVLLSAYVHFKSQKEAEDCVRMMNYMWVENRQLICLLLDEIILRDN